jgi:hypothetical protein
LCEGVDVVEEGGDVGCVVEEDFERLDRFFFREVEEELVLDLCRFSAAL